MIKTATLFSISDLNSYLERCYLSENSLVSLTKISISELKFLQTKRVMPLPSYKLKTTLLCQSFFGVHKTTEEINYYPKSYVKWLSQSALYQSSEKAFNLFSQSYRNTVEKIEEQVQVFSGKEFDLSCNEHLHQEWQHFLNGTYGLCTKSGLANDIARKELSTLIIQDLIEMPSLTAQQLDLLRIAVNLLDQASSLFAPHERERSSRARLIDEPRKRFNL